MSPSGPDSKFTLVTLHVLSDAHVTGLEKVIMKKIAKKYVYFVSPSSSSYTDILPFRSSL